MNEGSALIKIKYCSTFLKKNMSNITHLAVSFYHKLSQYAETSLRSDFQSVFRALI